MGNRSLTVAAPLRSTFPLLEQSRDRQGAVSHALTNYWDALNSGTHTRTGSRCLDYTD